MNNNPLGVFDSGVGGLSCVPEIAKVLPNEQIVYFGDTGRAPYGSRPESEIIELSLDVADRLINMGCRCLSIACNTISAVALDAIEKQYPAIPVIGIINPAAEYIAKNYSGKTIGLIATEATVKSEAYPKAIKEFGGNVNIKALATPEFVPLIEAGKADSEEMKQCIKQKLDGFTEGLDALILGCTHYPFIADQIKALYPDLELINPAKALAEKTYEVLKARGNLATEKLWDNKYISSSGNEFFEETVLKVKEIIKTTC